MKKRITIGIASCIIIIAVSNGKILNAILNLLIVGIVPGTSYSVPYWAMMAIYCLIITLLVTYWVEKAFQLHRLDKRARVKSRPSRRRYSHS